MGMFDSVKGNCPSCQKEVELQSKAGKRLLASYSLNKIPVEIAGDLNLKWDELQNKCEHCGAKFVLRVNNLPKTVEGEFVEVSDDLELEIENFLALDDGADFSGFDGD